ncbi:energy transducer TonB [Acinetobacter sp. TR11]|jgi:protein TonB|uniref:energy transducer TonB n=1 Tax=Acinetobacter sp. TR11 TaxID=3003393 RepID=UPI0022ABD335|nr:energy transducer TonB [Acinetobacter sp. TR11]WAU73060.1 TonB family protein [Acinetobacter sp. TR11]
MSQSPAIFNMPHPMKKKIIAALVAVVIGHVGVLWAVSHMKTIELRPIEKEPLKVKFVKIKEPPKPEPPKPKEKPKPEPKKEVKEVKVVEKPLPPPKKIEKVQQVKEAPKPVLQKTEQKIEPKVETKVVTTVTEKVVEKPQPVQEVAKPQPAADPSPKRVSIGGSGIQWSRSPKVSFTPKDLENQTRLISVYIEADEKGKITNVRITRSSGLPNIDEKTLRAIRSSKFKPYMENGIAYPIKTEQPFEFNP